MPRIILTLMAVAILVLAGAVALNSAVQTRADPGRDPAAADQVADSALQLPAQLLPPEQRDVRPIPVRPAVQPLAPRPDARAVMMSEISEALAQEMTALADLRTRLAAATTDATAAEVIA
jgi:hypothetical protein